MTTKAEYQLMGYLSILHDNPHVTHRDYLITESRELLEQHKYDIGLERYSEYDCALRYHEGRKWSKY